MKLAYSQFTQGTAQDNLSQGKLLSIKFAIPDDVNDQARIAGLVAQYDNLIENNRRRIQLLEESARLLYKEWFCIVPTLQRGNASIDALRQERRERPGEFQYTGGERGRRASRDELPRWSVGTITTLIEKEEYYGKKPIHHCRTG